MTTTISIQKLIIIITRVSHLLPTPILPNDEVDLDRILKVDPDRDLLTGDEPLLLLIKDMHEDTLMIMAIMTRDHLILLLVTGEESILVPKEEENCTRV
jgi:hypothetical protein